MPHCTPFLRVNILNISSDLNPDKQQWNSLRTMNVQSAAIWIQTNTTLELLTDSERTEFQCCVCLDSNRCWSASTAGRCCLNSEQSTKIRTLPHGCTNFGYFVAWATKYLTRAPNIYSSCIFTRTKKKDVSFHTHLAESSRRQWSSQVTPKLRVLSVELCFNLPFSALGIVGGTKRFVKFVDPWYSLFVTPLRT